MKGAVLVVALLLLAGCATPDNETGSDGEQSGSSTTSASQSTTNSTSGSESTNSTQETANETVQTVWNGTSITFVFEKTGDFAAQYTIEYGTRGSCSVDWKFSGADGIFAGYHSDSWSSALANRAILVNNGGQVTNPSSGPNTGGGTANRPNQSGSETALVYADGDGQWSMILTLECENPFRVEQHKTSNQTTLLRGDTHTGTSAEIATTGATYLDAAWSFDVTAPAELFVYAPNANQAEWTFDGPTTVATTMDQPFTTFDLSPGAYQSVLNGHFLGNRAPWAAVVQWIE
ncbi:MAG: hypothetical protein ACPHK8_04365 [Thermoplasmatota archaeon]